jgi:PHP family Zn ribbon phosphoesterase
VQKTETNEAVAGLQLHSRTLIGTSAHLRAPRVVKHAGPLGKAANAAHHAQPTFLQFRASMSRAPKIYILASRREAHSPSPQPLAKQHQQYKVQCTHFQIIK